MIRYPLRLTLPVHVGYAANAWVGYVEARIHKPLYPCPIILMSCAHRRRSPAVVETDGETPTPVTLPTPR